MTQRCGSVVLGEEIGRRSAAECVDSSVAVARDPALRGLYADAALRHIPRLLAAVDRHPLHATYGCFDRQFWHYRTADFPSEMYQEAVLPLALAFARPLPGNRWHNQTRVRELAVAGIHFAARSCHRDGSCDDYYPYERALGAAVFSLAACAKAYQTLALNDAAARQFFIRRGRWLATHGETGQLANHQALAALGLWRVHQITGDARFARAAREKLDLLLSWQSTEGWFREYGGADPGYHTVTLSCLAELRRETADPALDQPLRRALDFARHFLHPDDSYAGDYGSRGSYHCYPHGFELLAGEQVAAADLADGCLRSLARGTEARFDDDRLVAHRTANLFESYFDWSGHRPPADRVVRTPAREPLWLAEARLLVHRSAASCTIVSAARGGVLKTFDASQTMATDTGLVVEFDNGAVAATQWHDPSRHAALEILPGPNDRDAWRLSVTGPLHESRHETATPAKQILFRLFLLTVGRWCRGLVRWLLQRRLIAARRTAPLSHTRVVVWQPGDDQGPARLRVTDRLVRRPGSPRVKRVFASTDLQAAYVAAANVYQDSVLRPWQEFAGAAAELNDRGQTEITREILTAETL